MLKSLVVLALIGLVDSISYMAVAPSLIFYVLQNGGNKEMYGLVMSAFSFASFCGKPVLGYWVDKGGNKFRKPYFFSFVVAIVGALMYFVAVSFNSNPTVALAFIFGGRLLSGLGGANQALGYAYLASTVKLEDQTRTNSYLAMTRILGMAMGPAVNILLQKIDTTLTIGSHTVTIDPLNSVGLLLAFGNALVLVIVLTFLEEPTEKELKHPNATVSGPSVAKRDIWKALLCIEILLPILTLLVVNSSFQLIDTALPPAAADGLGWGPVETSGVLGSTSVVIFCMIFLVLILSGKVSDLLMVAWGNILWIIGGTGMYLLWTDYGTTLQYVIPVMVACSGFPFIAAANRSNFTKAVASIPELESSQGVMQAVLSMASSVAGFVTPGLVAAYVVRSPEEVAASRDHRELTPLALYVTIFPMFILFGLYKLHRKQKRILASQPSDMEANEMTGLIRQGGGGRRSSVIEIDQEFSRKAEVARRSSVQIMGMTAFDTNDEKHRRASMLNDLEELVKMGEIAYADDDDAMN